MRLLDMEPDPDVIVKATGLDLHKQPEAIRGMIEEQTEAPL